MYKSGVVYGALIAGEHVFYIGGTGKKEYMDAHARFSDLWIVKDGEWKLSRVSSYDHKPVKKTVIWYLHLKTKTDSKAIKI